MKIATTLIHTFFLLSILALAYPIHAQTTGGNHIFSMLQLPNSARTTALAGQQIAYTHPDLSMIGNNPALLNSQLHQYLHFSTLFLPSGINAHNLAYAHHFKRTTGALQLQFINYGKFTHTNPDANILGNFYGNDFNLAYTTAYQKNKWTLGATGKFLYSVLEAYTATALAADVGATWHNPETNTSLGVAVKNAGTILNSYNQTENNEKLPFDVQMGFSKRLAHVPFRFSVNAHHLHLWDIRYNNPNEAQQTILFGETTEEKSYFADILFRHLVFSGELYLGKPLSIQIAYNHQVRQEMRLTNIAGMAGFSFGLGIQTKKFAFNYGLGVNSLAGSAHHLSFTSSFGQWKKK